MDVKRTDLFDFILTLTDEEFEWIKSIAKHRNVSMENLLAVVLATALAKVYENID